MRTDPWVAANDLVSRSVNCKQENQVTGDKKVWGHVISSSGPQPFWHQGPVSWKTLFPWMAGVGDGSGGNVSDGEGQMKLRWIAHRSPPAARPGS